jgi:hypothetical protein
MEDGTSARPAAAGLLPRVRSRAWPCRRSAPLDGAGRTPREREASPCSGGRSGGRAAGHIPLAAAHLRNSDGRGPGAAARDPGVDESLRPHNHPHLRRLRPRPLAGCCLGRPRIWQHRTPRPVLPVATMTRIGASSTELGVMPVPFANCRGRVPAAARSRVRDAAVEQRALDEPQPALGSDT